MARNTLSSWLLTSCLLHCTLSVAQPFNDDRDLVLAGGSLSKMLAPLVVADIFHPGPDQALFKRETKWTVQSGDTGNGIAVRLGIEFAELASLNPGVQWQNLQIGQVLTIPCTEDDMPSVSDSTEYTVVAGDTGNGIAISAEITFEALSAANPGVNWYLLQIGQILRLPTPAASVSPSTTTPTPVLTISNPLASTPISIPSYPNVTTTLNMSDLPTPVIVLPGVSSTLSSTIVDDSLPPATYPTGTSPFLTPPGSKGEADLPIVNVRLIRNEEENPTYTIKAGDTGYNIAMMHDVSFGALSDANPAVVWTNLQTGQTLRLPDVTARAQVSGSVQSVPRKIGEDVYIMYTGSAAIPPYPPMDSWLSFTKMWESNLMNIGTNCDFASGKVPINTKSETEVLRKSIVLVSVHTSVNPSFILATILQESAGCVRAPTTKSWEGVNNPGLMQSFKGRYTCNTGSRIMQPCSDNMIKNMIMDGVKGNVDVGIVPALKTAASNFGVTWPMASANVSASAGAPADTGSKKKVDEALLYYQAARIYNSGSLPANGDLSGVTGSTRCYVSDIVNRLGGWVNANKQCS